MKYYKCDQCGDEFDSEDGMIEGQYIHVRKIQFSEHTDGWDPNRVKRGEYKVKKTIELYTTTSAPQPTDMILKKDLCLRCVKLLERP
jgi:hypothetical protein